MKGSKVVQRPSDLRPQLTLLASPKPLRVAIVTETFVPKMDGVVRSILELLRYLRRNGHEAMVFCPGRGPEEVEGYPVVRGGGVSFPLYPELQLTLRCANMLPILRRWRPDVVHLAGPAVLGWQAIRVAAACGIPTAAHFQTNVPAYTQHYGVPHLEGLAWRYFVSLHNRCTVNYVPTPTLANEASSHGMRRLRVMGRGVDTEVFNPRFRSAALRRVWGVEPGQIALLYVGRVAAEKNLSRLVDLAVGLENSRLVIVGDGPYLPTLRHQLGRHAHFCGRLSGVNLSTAYASADMFVFPSITETFGQVIQEAMASALPVVAMRAGGSEDVVQHGVTGMLADPNDAQAWFRTVEALAGNPLYQRLFGRKGRQAALQRSWDSVFHDLLLQYRQLGDDRAEDNERPGAFSPTARELHVR